jgi:hypothetical protein
MGKKEVTPGKSVHYTARGDKVTYDHDKTPPELTIQVAVTATDNDGSPLDYAGKTFRRDDDGYREVIPADSDQTEIIVFKNGDKGIPTREQVRK